MKKTRLLIIICISLLTLQNPVKAEGTKELFANNCSNHGSLVIWQSSDINQKFASWACPAEYRLNIRVNSGEIIYFGFNLDDDDLYYRLRNPNGTIVIPSTKISSSSAGWISDCTEALTGPSALYSGGYNEKSYTALMDGDYYIEFAIDQDSSKRSTRKLTYSDITVATSGGTAKPGRVWSKQWGINTDSYSNPFQGSMYTYSNDSIITKFDFNGMQPYAFRISCNSYGASNVGTLAERRRSRYRQDILNEGGLPGVPEYPVFINIPDTLEFPPGTFGFIDSFYMSNVITTNNCLNIWVTKTAQVSATLAFPNGANRYLIDTIVKGGDCIYWDGKDANGNMVGNDDSIIVTLHYAGGITHLPLIDVENQISGFTVTVIKPNRINGQPVAQPLLYWSDTLLTDPANSLDGNINMVGASSGSHQWQDRGTNNSSPEVINTWWYTGAYESQYTIRNARILPVELTSFSGTAENDAVSLDWNTAMEESFDKFVVERSEDGYQFEDIGEVQANGSSSTYQFKDKQIPVFSTVLFYRLKMTDLNKQYEYSKMISVKPIHTQANTLVYLNSEHSFVFKSKESFPLSFDIINAKGQLLYSGTAISNTTYQMPKNISGYLLFVEHVSDAGQRQVYKIYAPR